MARDPIYYGYYGTVRKHLSLVCGNGEGGAGGEVWQSQCQGQGEDAAVFIGMAHGAMRCLVSAKVGRHLEGLRQAARHLKH